MENQGLQDAGAGAEDAYYSSIKSNKSLRKEGENMSDMREAFPEPGELLVIPVERALPAVIPRRKNPAPI